MPNATAASKLTSTETIRGKLRDEAVIRIAQAVTTHPRHNQLFKTLAGLYAWIDRAQQHYLNEIDRIGPTEARTQLRRIVNDVALVG
jgi:hypothetical protein